jgi:hypothetical protein
VHGGSSRSYFARWTNWTGWIAAAACLALAALVWLDRTPAMPGDRAARLGAGVRSTTYAPGPELQSRVQMADLLPAEFAPAPDTAPSTAPTTGGAAQLDEVIAADTLTQEDAEALYAASLLMDMVAHIDAGGGSFAQADRVRRITEYDNLLPRLAEARKNSRAEDHGMIYAAEAILFRIVRGPISVTDLQELRNTIIRMSLHSALEAASERWKRSSV